MLTGLSVVLPTQCGPRLTVWLSTILISTSRTGVAVLLLQMQRLLSAWLMTVKGKAETKSCTSSIAGWGTFCYMSFEVRAGATPSIRSYYHLTAPPSGRSLNTPLVLPRILCAIPPMPSMPNPMTYSILSRPKRLTCQAFIPIADRRSEAAIGSHSAAIRPFAPDSHFAKS